VLQRPDGFRGAFRSDLDARAVYSEAAGIHQMIPRAVAVPADALDVESLISWAASRALPIVPRGAGSSMSGGAVGDGIILDVGRLRHLGSADAAARRVACGPGVTRRAVDREAREVGMRFPVDPSSGAFCTVGGMASTNAAGAHSLAFGATRRWIRSLDCVFADGSRATLRRGSALPENAVLDRLVAALPEIIRRARAIAPRRVRKDSSGYGVHAFAESHDPIDLLVGSEGTLAIFVGLELDLAPVPEGTASLLAAFRTLEAAAEGARLARDADAVACELLDRTFLDVAAAGTPLPVPNDTEAVLLVELEGAPATLAPRVRAISERFTAAGASTVTHGLDAGSEEALWSLRHAASPILARLDPSLRSMQIIEDGAVPPEHLADYVRGVRRALERQRLRGVLFGHAGDAHVHANALVDVRDADWRERVARLFDDVIELTVSLGGTLAGEHGDGRLRAGALRRVWDPDSLSLFSLVKQTFDPAGIFNPGVKGSGGAAGDALTPNKYDPALPPLPRAARQTLDRVTEERAYDRERLELLDHVVE
jgi:FAD/FMN-containing dehydrogenase